MEPSSSRLYSGPLSQAAQRILAVLRAQSHHASRRNHNSCNRRQIVERYYGSQRELWGQSSWSMSQEESKDTDRPWSTPQVSSFPPSYRDSSTQWQSSQTSACYQSSQRADCSLSLQAASPSSPCWDSSLQREAPQTEAYYQCSQMCSHRKHSEPRTCQSSQTQSFSQHGVTETAASYSHRDRYTLQIPQSVFEHQATPWKASFTEEIRPSYKGRDEVLFPTAEPFNPHKEELSLACHPVSYSIKISEETDNHTPAVQEKKKVTENWNIPRDEFKDTVTSNSQVKWKLSLSNPGEEISCGGKDGGTRYQQLESETTKTVEMNLLPSGCVRRQETRCDEYSPKLMTNLVGEEGVELIVDSENITEAGTGQMSNTEYEMQDGVMWKEKRHTLINEKTNEVWGIQFLRTNKNSSLERNLNFLSTTSLVGKICCDAVGEKLGEKKENDFEFRVDTPEVIGVGAMGEHQVSPCRAENAQDTGQTGARQKHHTEKPLVQGETKLLLGDEITDNLERTTEERTEMMNVRLEMETESRTKAGIDTGTEDKMETEQQHFSDVQPRERECERSHCREVTVRDTEQAERGRNRDEPLMPPVDSENEITPTEDAGRESCSTPTLSQEWRVKRSGFRAPCLYGNLQHHDNVQTVNGSIRGSSSSVALNPANTFSAGQRQNLFSAAIKPSKKMESINLFPSHHPPMIPSFHLKRKHEVLQHKKSDVPPKNFQTRRPPKWEPPHSLQEKGEDGEINELKRARPKTFITEHREPPTKVSPSHKTGILLGVLKDPYSPKQTGQTKKEEKSCETTVAVSKQIPSLTCKLKHKQTKYWPKMSHEGADDGDPQNQSKAGCLTATLTTDPRVKDSVKLNQDEKMQVLEKARKAKVLVLTLVYRDGTTQLDPEQVSQVISGLYSLYWLNVELCSKLQSQGLWELYSDMELNMITVLAAMESHRINVDKGALKRTSDLLGTKMKQLEQEAHRAAGQIFLVTSNAQLRTVLFEKLCLHERCENKRLPKTINKQQQSTSEAALLQLQDLHPLPKIILEYRQLSVQLFFIGRCLLTSARWSCVSWLTFPLTPELLRIFTHPQADVFTMLASQWKGVSEAEVTSEDREHAKRIVYSVVYGAGRERLSGILGVSAEQASRFQDSFLQTYREVQAFIQRTVQQCHKQGYVLSVMGRRRTLPNINSSDWGIRMQAERQAVNFVVQGSAADLCKMAMIRIFNLVSSSSSLSARLIAQLHDELLYEVEDSQVEEFAALVRSTMESLQHIDHLGVHLKRRGPSRHRRECALRALMWEKLFLTRGEDAVGALR
ncbi:hypothetical protein L3Q82_004031 [Scortum barcoo]|uniref:Uncharacterized protein n=1 Tax=Scortum barcoo TaxID=214431 RepID=A0ACB8X7P6_9TELE|nr:hypothetical protein L3Q82_004031 [Scortum barcoo]